MLTNKEDWSWVYVKHVLHDINSDTSITQHTFDKIGGRLRPLSGAGARGPKGGPPGGRGDPLGRAEAEDND